MSGLKSVGQLTGMKMDEIPADVDLVGSYAREGSESAFHALVARHIQLVFATALRQTGDRGLAEEITQNTFVQLARKAPSLLGHKTIAGWLHKTALLESKHRIRTELRRRRREQTAVEISNLGQIGSNPIEALVPMLDEGLLSLRDSERLALILRFMEGFSFSEVGSTLGVSEEAARKRVDRALSRLSEFFRVRGFAVPVASGSALLSQAAPILPVDLTQRCIVSGLSAGSGGGFLANLAVRTSFLSPARGALLGGLLACLPVIVHWPLIHAERVEIRRARDQLLLEQSQLAELRAQAVSLEQQKARRLRTVPVTSTRNQGFQPTATSPLDWKDSTPWVRIPKSMLASIEVFGVRDNQGHLSEALIEMLQLTSNEIALLEGSLQRFLEGCHAAEATGMQRVQPMEADLLGRKPADIRVFTLADTSAEIEVLREQLLREFNETLDPERVQLLRKSLNNWMPWDNTYRGLSSSYGVNQFARRECYSPYPEQPHVPGQAVLGWSLSAPGHGLINSTRYVDEIPAYLRPHLQDWIDEARRINDQPIQKQPAQP